jgi:hypothetical protein
LYTPARSPSLLATESDLVFAQALAAGGAMGGMILPPPTPTAAATPTSAEPSGLRSPGALTRTSSSFLSSSSSSSSAASTSTSSSSSSSAAAKHKAREKKIPVDVLRRPRFNYPSHSRDARIAQWTDDLFDTTTTPAPSHAAASAAVATRRGGAAGAGHTPNTTTAQGEPWVWRRPNEYIRIIGEEELEWTKRYAQMSCAVCFVSVLFDGKHSLMYVCCVWFV